MVAAAAGDHAVRFALVVIERRGDGQSRVTVGEIGEDRASEIADPDQSDQPFLRTFEDRRDAVDQSGDLVTGMRIALIADRHHIAAHLCGSIARQSGKLM